MNTVKVLELAQDIISEKSRWTQHNMARNEQGQAVEPSDKTAVKWCAIGAITRICDQLPKGEDTSLVKNVALSSIAHKWEGNYNGLIENVKNWSQADRDHIDNHILIWNDGVSNAYEVINEKFKESIEHLHNMKKSEDTIM